MPSGEQLSVGLGKGRDDGPLPLPGPRWAGDGPTVPSADCKFPLPTPNSKLAARHIGTWEREFAVAVFGLPREGAFYLSPPALPHGAFGVVCVGEWVSHFSATMQTVLRTLTLL